MTQSADQLVSSNYVRSLFAPDDRPSALKIWRWVNAGVLPEPIKLGGQKLDKLGRPKGKNYWRRGEIDKAIARMVCPTA